MSQIRAECPFRSRKSAVGNPVCPTRDVRLRQNNDRARAQANNGPATPGRSGRSSPRPDIAGPAHTRQSQRRTCCSASNRHRDAVLQRADRTRALFRASGGARGRRKRCT
eukprot:840205-Rhodomonas_salina.1